MPNFNGNGPASGGVGRGLGPCGKGLGCAWASRTVATDLPKDTKLQVLKNRKALMQDNVANVEKEIEALEK
ncbi:MAG: DUF5320 domain-containing protein [Patescibacteria group bacterium]